MKPNFRGKGRSTTKFTKAGDPKQSGNWSYSTIHSQNLQSRDYYVHEKTFESGIKMLIVGDHTPLARLIGQAAADLAQKDKHFDLYIRRGYKTVGEKKYEAYMQLRKRKSHIYDIETRTFIYREMIYTDGDFNYHFPEY